MEKIKKSQAERIKDALLEISVDVTPEDKNAATKELPVSQPTVSRYLNGDVADINKALKLYNFFKKQIDLREKLMPAA